MYSRTGLAYPDKVILINTAVFSLNLEFHSGGETVFPCDNIVEAHCYVVALEMGNS